MLKDAITKAGNPILKQVAEAVTSFGTKELDELVEHLVYNLKHHNGAGLAAPQIGESKRVIVYGFEGINPRYPNERSMPLTVIINPEIIYFSKEQAEAYEGCLSLPRIRGLVPRAYSIRYKGFTVEGRPVEKEVHGFEARVVQHEIDHIDGIMYPERMVDARTFIYTEN